MSEQSDVTGVVDVVLRERACRDTGQWEGMRSTFASDSRVQLSWFDGTGSQFVDASQDMYERGSQAFHSIGAVSAEIRGDRALACEGSTVHLRGVLGGVEVDVASHGRLYQRLIKVGAEWRICELTMLYYKDVVSLVNPVSDPSGLTTISIPFDRPYKYLAALLLNGGFRVSADLPGIDQPAAVTRYIDAHHDWLWERA